MRSGKRASNSWPYCSMRTLVKYAYTFSQQTFNENFRFGALSNSNFQFIGL